MVGLGVSCPGLHPSALAIPSPAKARAVATPPRFTRPLFGISLLQISTGKNQRAGRGAEVGGQGPRLWRSGGFIGDKDGGEGSLRDPQAGRMDGDPIVSRAGCRAIGRRDGMGTDLALIWAHNTWVQCQTHKLASGRFQQGFRSHRNDPPFVFPVGRKLLLPSLPYRWFLLRPRNPRGGTNVGRLEVWWGRSRDPGHSPGCTVQGGLRPVLWVQIKGTWGASDGF